VPIYEYACQECGHRLDALQKMHDDPLVDCPECNAAQLQRQLSAPRFRLKGKGWYETDFKKDNQRNVHKSDAESDKSNKADSKKDKPGEKKADQKKEPKPASKTESK